MIKETTGAKEALRNLKLKESDIFGSTEPPIFTQFGKHLYGLFVIHKNDIEEARRDGASSGRLEDMMNKETGEKLVGVKKEWNKKFPRDAFVIECVEKQFLEILGKRHL